MCPFTVLLSIGLMLNGVFQNAKADSKGVANLSMRMAQQVCKQSRTFAYNKKIQCRKKTSSKLSPNLRQQNTCRYIHWTKCGKRNRNCSKFEIKECSPGEIESMRSPPIISTRINKGDAAQPNEFPFQVRIVRTDNVNCSGIIINPNYVLTSRRCVTETGTSPSSLQVIAGDHSVELKEASEQIREANHFVLHEQFDQSSLAYDVALIYITDAFNINDKIQPAIVPPQDFDAEGFVAVSGWGLLGDLGQDGPAKVLNRVITAIITDEECDRSYGKLEKDVQICTSPFTGGPCKGDTGGAMSQIWKNKCYRAVGIVSGDIHCSAPYVYAEVAKFYSWIQGNIHANFRPYAVSNGRSGRGVISGRSHGGSNANPNEFPHQVRVTHNDQTVCGGTIITETVIVTSAMCVEVFVKQNLKIIAGDHQISVTENTEQTSAVIEVVFHAEFDRITLVHNIAILRLETPLKFNKEVNAALIPRPFSSPVGRMIVTGWGDIGTQGTVDTLGKLEMRIISFDDCSNAYGCALMAHVRTVICAKSDGNAKAGICGKDWGAPMVSKLSNGSYMLNGIGSFRLGCDTEIYPSVFTSVGMYSSWIQLHASKHGNEKAKPNEFPFLALITVNAKKCNGVILNAWNIVTAAHCFDQVKDLKNPQGTVIVDVGKFRLKETDPTEKKAQIKDIILHEKFDRERFAFNNIALIRLSQPLELGPGIQPVNLPPPNFQVKPYDEGIVSGWGDFTNLPLLKATFPIITHRECKLSYSFTKNQIIQDEMVCTAPIFETFCIVQDGGPLTQIVQDITKCYRLIGVLARNQDCGNSGLPSIYSDALKYKDWLQSNINKGIQQNQKTARAESGRQANLNEFPFQARLLKNNLLLCGATILNKEFVLTSAFCVFQENMSELKVIAGGNSNGEKQQQSGIRSITIKDDYDSITHANDLAMIRLATQLTFDDSVKPIKIPNQGFEASGLTNVTGWDAVGTAGDSPMALNVVTKLIITQEECWKSYGCALYYLKGKVICAKPEDGDSGRTCTGEHGGSITAYIDGSHSLIGISSFRGLCGAWPSIFTKVDDNYNWIRTFVPDPEKGQSVIVTEASYEVIVLKHKKPKCGGTIINARHVLTSADCVTIPRVVDVVELSVIAGRQLINTETPDEQVRGVQDIHAHEQFDSNTGVNNIALLVLDQPLRFQTSIQPAIVPPADFNVTGMTILSGWNIANEGGPGNLQRVPERVITDEECKNAYDGAGRTHIPEMTCIADSPGAPCITDTGGPMAQVSVFQDKCHTAVGIAPPICRLQNLPVAFTEVTKYRSWIEANLYANEDMRSFRRLGTKMKPRSSAAVKEFIFHARILRYQSEVCSGTILNEFYVLTSAYCTIKARNMSIIAGDVKISTAASSRQQRKVDRIFVHEEFDPITRANDIALLNFDEPLNFNDDVGRITLAQTETLPNAIMTFTGWGTTANEDFQQDFLQNIPMTIVDMDKCRLQYGCSLHNLTDNIFCAKGHTPDEGFCLGDMGGPLILKGNDGKYVQYGIASYRVGCTDDIYPTIFTKVSAYSPWIHSKLIGGKPVLGSEFPFHLKILINGRLRCSGTILGEWHVLTDRTCITNFGGDTSDLTIVAGNYRFGHQIRRVDNIFMDGNPTDINVLALLELEKKFSFNIAVQPAIPAPPKIPPKFRAEDAFISGWGVEFEGAREGALDQLYQNQLTPIGDQPCRDAYSNTEIKIPAEYFCTTPNAHRICFTDIGTPWVWFPTDHNKCYVAVGIIVIRADCVVPRRPSVFISIDKFMDWINKSISNTKISKPLKSYAEACS